MSQNCINTKLHEEGRQRLVDRLAKNPGILLEQLAQNHDCSLAAVVECLPEDMWQKLPGSTFIPLLEEIHRWQTSVTVLSHSSDVILEFTGPLPGGMQGHGFYNLENSTGLHGHLRYKNCAAIYLVERPFMGKTTVSLLFCNMEGAAMFKIFVGRDHAGQLLTQQRQALHDFVRNHAQERVA